MRICVPALAGIFSCVAVAAFGQNPDLTGTWTRTQTDSSAICKIEQTGASISFNLKTPFPGWRVKWRIERHGELHARRRRA
jgi:hypothetical protein